MNRVISFVATIALVGIARQIPRPTPTVDVTWAPVHTADGRFTAMMPGRVNHTQPPGTTMHEYVSSIQNGHVAFVLTCTPKMDQSVSLDERFAWLRRDKKATNPTLNACTLAGIAGRELYYDNLYDGRYYRHCHRMCYADGTLYELEVIWTITHPAPVAEGERFLASLTRTATR